MSNMKISNSVEEARLVHFLLWWCTSCSVGALLALASGKAERRQVHPLKDNLFVGKMWQFV